MSYLPDANRRQPLPHHFASETFEGQRTLSECKLAGTKIHKPEKDETPSLSDPGPLNVRRPHPHRVQPTETGCRNVEPSRKEDHGKDCMYRGAELAAAPRTGGTPLRPCPTSGTPFGSTTGRRVIGQRGGCRALNNTKRTLQSYRDQERFPARDWVVNSTTDAGTWRPGSPAKPFKRDSHAAGLSQ